MQWNGTLDHRETVPGLTQIFHPPALQRGVGQDSFFFVVDGSTLVSSSGGQEPAPSLNTLLPYIASLLVTEFACFRIWSSSDTHDFNADFLMWEIEETLRQRIAFGAGVFDDSATPSQNRSFLRFWRLRPAATSGHPQPSHRFGSRTQPAVLCDQILDTGREKSGEGEEEGGGERRWRRPRRTSQRCARPGISLSSKMNAREPCLRENWASSLAVLSTVVVLVPSPLTPLAGVSAASLTCGSRDPS